MVLSALLRHWRILHCHNQPLILPNVKKVKVILFLYILGNVRFLSTFKPFVYVKILKNTEEFNNIKPIIMYSSSPKKTVEMF